MAFWSSLGADVGSTIHEFVTFVPMLKVLFALFVGFVWSGVLKILSERHKAKGHKTPYRVKWWQQHTTPMYIIFVVTFMCELWDFHDVVSNNTLLYDRRTAWRAGLDLNLSMGIPYDHNTTRCLRRFECEIQINHVPEGDCGVLQPQVISSDSIWFVAIIAPICVTLTFVVGAFSTFKHLRQSQLDRPECMWNQYNRGSTLWILQLPVVYSLCALYSVQIGILQSQTGDLMCMDVLQKDMDGPAFFIEAGLSFGDCYEAIALLLFADITMNVIENVVDKVCLDAESVKTALESIEVAVNAKLKDGDKGDVKEDFHTLREHNGRTLTRLGKMSEKLVHSTWSLSILGIQYFAISCFVVALPQLLACQAFAWHSNDWFRSFTDFYDNWEVTFKGMGLLGSCVAIHNMIKIESNFDKHFLEGFAAKYKFVSVKIMVSIIFIQQMALPAVLKLTMQRSNFFDASLRILEFTFISLFNLLAWPLDHGSRDFYKMEAIDVGDMENLEENLIEDDTLGNLGASIRTMKTQKKRSPGSSGYPIRRLIKAEAKLCVGMEVTVLEPFASCRVGMRGRVAEMDADGDARIMFDEQHFLWLVTKKEFQKLSMQQVARVK